MQLPPSRNAPCPCGSGKRYKECHGALPSPPAQAGASDDFTAAAQSALASGRPTEALDWLRRAFDAEPGRLDLLRECARLESMSGNPDRAAADCRTVLLRSPGDVAAWTLLGEIVGTTDPHAAEDAWRRALELAPGNAEAHFHLGNLYRGRGEPARARSEYERALEAAPDHAGILNNLGLALEACGERDAAEACYRRVLAATPQHADALGNLASSLFEREAFRQSVATYDQLFAIRRDVPAPVWVRRGMAHQRINDLASAEMCFEEAARLSPDDARIQRNLGTVRHEQKRYSDAEPAWLRAAELRPESAYVLSMLAYGRQHRCDWRDLGELHERLNRLIEYDEIGRGEGVNPFALLAMPTSPLAQLRSAEHWARDLATPSPVARPLVARAPGGRLRVGFVSSDFRDHPMVYLSLLFWESIDRDRIETFAYGIRERDRGPIGESIAKAFEHFADVNDESIDATVKRIRDDRIDVLVDLNGYTQHARERIFVLRPAPVQISYLGFPGTMGAAWYDCALVDRFGAPDTLQPFFTERLLQLPHASFPSDTRRAPKGPPPTHAECGLPPNAFVFSCFNNLYKILPDVFAVWMRLLHAVPGSVLWLLAAEKDAEHNLRREAAATGIDPSRLYFAPRTDVARHVARTGAADLVVDTFPYGAHTTANDALLAGVPLVTCAGETLVSRIAGSQLRAIGLPELVTRSLADYEATARRLATDPGELVRFGGRLAENRASFPLFDMGRFTRDFEALLFRASREFGDRA